MLVGHYGVALALKRVEPRLSLGTLFLSVQLVDVLWGVFVLLGWERVRVVPGFTAVNPLVFESFPYTHSLAGGVFWGLLAGALYYSWPTRDRRHHDRAALIVAAAVLSHWFLDLLVHIPDLPLLGDDSPKLGLGLWRSLPATLLAELLVLGAGAAYYAAGGSRRHPVNRVRLGIVLAVLVAVYLAGLFGPTPSSTTAIGVGAVVLLLALTALGIWLDRSRAVPVADEPPVARRGAARRARRRR